MRFSCGAILLGLFVGALPTMPAAAADGATDYVRCVQQELTDLPDYDPRGVDGAIGPGTKAAAEQYAADHPAADLADLSPETAETWCRSLAKADPDRLMQRVVIDTDLPDDYQMGLRIFGGPKTEYIFGWIHIADSGWDMVSVDGKLRRTAMFPKALLSRVTYFCIDSQGEPGFTLLEKIETPYKRDAISGSHPNYMGICRWNGRGGALSSRTDVVSVAKSGDLMIRYRVKPR